MDLGIQYEPIISGTDRFSVTTNFGDILKNALAKIDQYIDGKFINREELDTLFRVLRGDKGAVDDLKNTLDKKKTELENKIQATADQAIEKTKQQGEQAVQDIIHGNTPSPSLPRSLSDL